jgi:signal transduction histidine kinase
MTGAKRRDRSSRSASIWAQAAHDLRQPVQAMLLQLPALERRSSQAERRRTVGQLEAALLSLCDMLEALALLARIEAGLQDAAVQTLRLQEVLSPLIKGMADAAWARRVTFAKSGTRALVHSHPMLLALATKSLVLNALALGRSGEAIDVYCRKRGERIVLGVSFNGVSHETGRDGSAFVLLGGAASGEAATAGAQAGALGLGLDLLERLCGHLRHTLEASGGEGLARTLAIVMPLAKAR